ncbi:hypothetical protein EY01_15640, partial [Staphylococcus aureus]|uniref:hypothetical protein n=1 Tax=Staphylococcus aureus TaxID=1280 RepID=UPI00065B668A
ALLRYERGNSNGEAAKERKEGVEDITKDLIHEKKLIDESIYGRITVVKDMHSRKQMMAKEVIESGNG